MDIRAAYLPEIFRLRDYLELRSPGNAATALCRVMASFGSVERYVISLLEILPPRDRNQVLKAHVRGKLNRCLDETWTRAHP